MSRSLRFMCPACDGEGGDCLACSGRRLVSMASLDIDYWYEARRYADPTEYAAALETREFVAWGRDLRADGTIGLVPLTAQDIVDGVEVAEWIAPPSFRSFQIAV